MSRALNLIGTVTALSALTACGAPVGLQERDLPKGAPVTVQSLLAEHAGQRICTDYDATSESCASIIDVVAVSGDRVTTRETAALNGLAGGGVETLTLRTKARIDAGRSCIDATDLSIDETSLDSNTAAFVLDATRSLIASSGGTCGSYFEAGDGYVVSVRGRDGSIFPPGDVRVDFFTGQRSLRPQ